MPIIHQNGAKSTGKKSKSINRAMSARRAGHEAPTERTLQYNVISPEEVRASVADAANPKLNAALEYLRRGRSVIPVNREKQAAVPWGKYQRQLPTEKDVRRWFGVDADDFNLGVVLGPVSDNLYARDFDVEESYLAWSAANPDLAKRLPTSRTSRGRHVFFRHLTRLGTRKFADGELRGDGGYVVVPPSIHGSGALYEWVVPMAGDVPVIDPCAAGFVPRQSLSVTEGDRYSEYNSNSKTLSVTHRDTLSVTLRNIAPDVQARILRVVPDGPGQRHWCVFGLARQLKAVPSFADGTFVELEPYLEPIFDAWFELALPFIRTKERRESWNDFADGWDRVLWPAGMEFLKVMFARAKSRPLPVLRKGRLRNNPDFRLLVSLCRELQLFHGDNQFYLSCRSAAGLLWPEDWEIRNLEVYTNRWLRGSLTKLGVLKITERPPRRSEKAYRYRYLGDMELSTATMIEKAA